MKNSIDQLNEAIKNLNKAAYKLRQVNEKLRQITKEQADSAAKLNRANENLNKSIGKKTLSPDVNQEWARGYKNYNVN